MSPTKKPVGTGTSRTESDGSVGPASLTEVTDGLESNIAAEALESQVDVPPPRRRPTLRRTVSVSVLGVGIVAGVLLAMHLVSVNKQQATLSASQSDKSSQLKPQSIPLANLGLAPIRTLSSVPNTLTVNGQLNVADSVVLEPTTQPIGAVAGQLFYDQSKNQLGYYNDKGFVYLQGGPTAGNSSVSNVSNVYNVTNVSNVSNITNVTNMLTGPVGVIPVFDGSGLSDSLITETGTHVTTTATVSVGTSTAGPATLNVVGAGSDSTTNALSVTNNSGDIFAQIADNGTVNLGRSPGAVFGNNVVFPTSDTGTAGIISADKFITSTDTTVVSMSVYVGSVSTFPDDQYQLAIYTDSGGQPGTYVASSPVGILTANSWNTLPVSASLAGGTAYWLAYTANNNQGWNDNPYYSLTSSPTHAWANFTFGSGPQNGWPTTYPPPGAVNDYTHTIYATTLGTGSALMLNNIGTLTASGAAVFQDLNNSSTAFQVQNAVGTAVLNVDTADTRVGIGTTAPKNSLDVAGGVAIGTYAGVDTAPADGLIVSGGVGIGTNVVGATKLTVQATGQDQVVFQGTYDANFIRPIEVLDSSVTAGHNIVEHIGHDLSTYDSGYFGFNYQGANSSANFVTLGLWGNDNILNIQGSGNVGIGTTAPNNGKLSIVGATSDATTNALNVRNSANTSLMQLKDDGSVNLGESHAVFGNDSSGDYTGNGYYSGGNQLMQAQSFTTTTGGTVSSMSTYIGQAISGTNNQYQLAIYSNAGSTPGTILASSAVGTLTSTGWNTLPITATLAANTTYWLVYWTNTNDGSHNGQNFIAGYSGANAFYQAYAAWQSGASNGMPTTFPAGSGPSGGYLTSIYATYATPVTAMSLDTSGNITSNGTINIQNSSSSALQVTDTLGGVAFYVDATSHDVGINESNTGGYNLNVLGTTALGDVSSSNAFKVFDGSSNPVLAVDTSGASGTVITVEGGGGGTYATLNLSNAHFSSTQTTAPTIATPLNCGTGTAPTSGITAGSTDAAGSFTITTGSTGPTTCDTTITFNKQYASIPKSILLTPTTAIGGATVSITARVSAVTATTVTVQIVSPAASTPYSYYYWVVQ